MQKKFALIKVETALSPAFSDYETIVSNHRCLTRAKAKALRLSKNGGIYKITQQ
jgi:hypothetical protein